MSSYESLLDEAIAIADEYSLSSFLNGFDSDLINVLLRNHIDVIQACTNYAFTMATITRALSAHVGMNLNIDTFITLQSDRTRLYEIFALWRSRLLSEIMFSHAV